MVLASSRQWRLPFSRDEGIIIALVVLAHLSLIIPFQFGLSPKPPDYQNDERVMANLVAPEAPQAPAKAAQQEEPFVPVPHFAEGTLEGQWRTHATS
jgi:hypothetical protein